MAKKDDFEESGGELNPVPNEKYKKFFDKFSEIDKLDVTQWKVAHVLGYFCKRYKETYNIDYHWKFNNENPAKCFEVWQANTLVAKLSANPKILKEYIDWVYSTVVSKLKKRFISISLFTKDDIVNDYKINVLLAGKKNLNVDRSTILPQEYQSVLAEVGKISITTYGELAFLSQMDPISEPLAEALNKLRENGFDEDLLKRIV